MLSIYDSKIGIKRSFSESNQAKQIEIDNDFENPFYCNLVILDIRFQYLCNARFMTKKINKMHLSEVSKFFGMEIENCMSVFL